MLTKSFVFWVKYWKIHLRAQEVPSNTCKYHLGPHHTTLITSYIYQYILVRLSRVCGGTRYVFGILTVALYQGTRSKILIMVFAISVRIFNKAQNKLGVSTHPIVSSVLM